MKIARYGICIATHPGKMIGEVNKWISAGWQPFGSLACDLDSDKTHPINEWYQPMVIYEDHPNPDLIGKD